MTQFKRETDPASLHLLSVRSSKTLRMSAAEQFAFWQLLQAPPKVTPAQRELGALIRGVKSS